ncbi:MAG: hypothetical protein A2Y14_00305 [Verrucomicrobia bacterium GWF2_51_19]|nr:MAG: hypothetical protein A2Y14_00305 [Verrucomicrobia bacterium GWF2_51_19]
MSESPIMLTEPAIFGKTNDTASAGVEALLKPYEEGHVFSYVKVGMRGGLKIFDGEVDGFFQLNGLGFEQKDCVISVGLRASRFAPILFWEIFHILKAGGTWVDIDLPERCGGTALFGNDFLDRAYFAASLTRQSLENHGAWTRQVFHKTKPSLLSASIDDKGWTFGILTGGKDGYAKAMVEGLLRFNVPLEIILCGPMPQGLPKDNRIRCIDLDSSEPRGWITRKKNLIAAEARYENLCLMHDRFEIPENFIEAMEAYGPCFAYLTAPTFYFPEATRQLKYRYPDYQIFDVDDKVDFAIRYGNIDGRRTYGCAYNDFREGAFACGGFYITKKTLWRRIPQKEYLFHAEWEDVIMGLECQRQGIPHRVNPYLQLRSLKPHPNIPHAWTFRAPDAAHNQTLSFVTEQWAEKAQADAQAFYPLLPLERLTYYRSVWQDFSPFFPKAPEVSYEQCQGLSDFWSLIYNQLSRYQDFDRKTLFALVCKIARYASPVNNGELQERLYALEQSLAQQPPIASLEKVIAWGACTRFAWLASNDSKRFAYLIDSDPRLYGTTLLALPVCSPQCLAAEDPSKTSLVVFANADSVYTEVAARGFHAIPYDSLYPLSRLFAPLFAWFEAENAWPKTFADSPVHSNPIQPKSRQQALDPFMTCQTALCSS